MRKILSIFAAALVAVAVNAEPVVLPATLDVNNVSFRSEGMPNFVLEEGDYAGTYFDMGAHDSANDTLLYAEWDVTIEPINYYVAVDVYNTNSWRVQLHVLNQAGDTVKDLRYKGSSGQCGHFAIGSIDMRDLEAGTYKVRARAATAWSAMKLKDVIFIADYSGVSVNLPGTLLPAYAELSANASISAEGAIAFKPSTAPDEYANWNVIFAQAGTYNVSIDFTASNGHFYGVELIGEDEETSFGAVSEGATAWDTGVKELGAIEVPAAGSYIVHLTNATQWSEAVLNSIIFAGEAAPSHTYTVAGAQAMMGVNWDPSAAANDMSKQGDGTYKLVKENVELAVGQYEYKVAIDHAWNQGEAGSNSVVDIATAGKYTITFTYDPATPATSANAELIEPLVILPTVQIAGSFNSWKAADLTPAEDNLTASVKLTLEAQDYEFKMVVASNWLSNAYEYHREFTGAEGITTNNDKNMVLKADQAGDYIVTWTYATNGINFTFPTATGMENANAAVKTVKMVENGQIVILKNGVRYNVLGMTL